MGALSLVCLFTSSTVNPWIALGYLDLLIVAVIISALLMVEVFFAVSAFLLSYRIFLLARLKGGSVTIGDIMKAYLRKVVRLVPIVWIIFFLTWGIYPRMNSGPIWS